MRCYSKLYYGDGYDHGRTADTRLQSNTFEQPSSFSSGHRGARVNQAAPSSQGRVTAGEYPTGRSREAAAANRGESTPRATAQSRVRCTQPKQHSGTRAAGNSGDDNDDDDDDDRDDSDRVRVNDWHEEEYAYYGECE